MNCITLDAEGKISAMYKCDDNPTLTRVSRTFMSEDIERLTRIQSLYKPSTLPILTYQAKNIMIKLHDGQHWGELREMIKKYFGIELCCTNKMTEIIATL